MFPIVIIALFLFVSFGLALAVTARRTQVQTEIVPLAPVSLVTQVELVPAPMPEYGRKVNFMTRAGAKLRVRVVGHYADCVALKRLGHPNAQVFYRRHSELV